MKNVTKLPADFINLRRQEGEALRLYTELLKKRIALLPPEEALAFVVASLAATASTDNDLYKDSLAKWKATTHSSTFPPLHEMLAIISASGVYAEETNETAERLQAALLAKHPAPEGVSLSLAVLADGSYSMRIFGEKSPENVAWAEAIQDSLDDDAFLAEVLGSSAPTPH